MSDPIIEARRIELNAWIARTRAHQKKLGIVLSIAAVVSIGLMVWNTTVGGAAFGTVALVALCGFWITAGHIMDWRNKLANLGKPKVLRVSGGGKRF
ncbi:MAG: hypothetical protein ABI175_22005 [Polyangiales bacterium]